jgi:hypothetical protein
MVPVADCDSVPLTSTGPAGMLKLEPVMLTDGRTMAPAVVDGAGGGEAGKVGERAGVEVSEVELEGEEGGGVVGIDDRDVEEGAVAVGAGGKVAGCARGSELHNHEGCVKIQKARKHKRR